eukprot:3879653-Prymnesium_polylepis.1
MATWVRALQGAPHLATVLAHGVHIIRGVNAPFQTWREPFPTNKQATRIPRVRKLTRIRRMPGITTRVHQNHAWFKRESNRPPKGGRG